MQQSRFIPTLSESSEQLFEAKSLYLICFSHLRWNFVYQRPQHLMSRLGRIYNVIYFEEPEYFEGSAPILSLSRCSSSGVTIATPLFPHGADLGAQSGAVRGMLEHLLATLEIARPVLWFYTPMMFAFASHLEAAAVVYDCMDELSHFRFAPPELPSLERALMARADLMFTGGLSLYDAKRASHPNIHAFPSSVDTAHFRAARGACAQPADQAALPTPRLGFYGVVDERMDIDLLAHLAQSRPDWSIVVVGPVVKIDPADLPDRPNIHYLGGKHYDELPAYLAGWDVALMPFALNEATLFISPTKTLEYLAGGKPVVSTPVIDVVRQYSGLEAVRIADTPEAFVAACDRALAMTPRPDAWIGAVDALLATLSWDKTFQSMSDLLAEAVAARSAREEQGAAATGPLDRPVGSNPHPEMAGIK